MLVVYLINILVGFIVGCSGIGGILVPPILVLWSGFEPHLAMGTALSSFLPLALVGVYMYGVKMRMFSFREAVPFTLGGLAGAAPGSILAAHVPSMPLILLLALLIIFAGVSALRSKTSSQKESTRSQFWHGASGKFVIGAVTGILAGLTGAGGPILSIPWMMAVGYPPLLAIGLAMPYQVATALSGCIGSAMYGHVAWSILPLLCLSQLAGFFSGLSVARRMSVAGLRTLIGILCCGLGCFLIVRELLPFV